MTNAIIVLNTCPNTEVATAIATQLVDEALAACVNIIPGLSSVYKWQGQRHIDQECLLIIKTQKACYEPIERRIQELHPYELPEVLALEVSAGASAYLSWIEANTRQQHE